MVTNLLLYQPAFGAGRVMVLKIWHTVSPILKFKQKNYANFIFFAIEHDLNHCRDLFLLVTLLSGSSIELLMYNPTLFHLF